VPVGSVPIVPIVHSLSIPAIPSLDQTTIAFGGLVGTMRVADPLVKTLKDCSTPDMFAS
jgi:hypothetical protein